jgi:hypothetical protein
MNKGKKGYWQIETTHNPWAYISCPIMESSELSFSTKRQLVIELQDIEKDIKKDIALMGWIGYARLINPHIMIMYLKLGAIPYKIDAIEQKIWFKKELL